MEEDSDDFGLGETGDLAIEHDDDFGSVARPQGRAPPVRKTTDDSLFGDGDDGGDIEIDHAPPPARPAAPVPRPGPGAPSRRRGADEDLFSDDDRDGGLGGLLGDDDLGGDLEIDHDPGPPAPPPPRPAAPLPPPSRGPSSRRPGADADLFSDDDRDDGLLGDSDLGGDLEIDHDSAPPPPPRPAAPMPAPSGKFTDPEISLDANDAELADLLGEPQRGLQPSLPPPAPQSLPPRPPAPVTVSAPPPPDPASSFALGEEDDELAELLGDRPSRPVPPPPPADPAPQRTLTRRVSFPDEPARPATLPAARGRPPAPAPDDDFADVDDGGGFGVLDDADREVARIASHNSRRGGGGLGLGPPSSGAPSFRSPAPQDSLADDFDSHHDELSFDARGPPPGRAPPPPAAPRRREDFDPYGDDFGEDSFDSPPGPPRGGRAPPGPPRGAPPPRGIPPRVAESSELYGEDTYGDSMYDSRDDGAAGFRRMPAPDTRGTPPARQGHGRPQAPGPYDGDGYDDDYDDYAEDDDDWADDLSWDGEIRHTRGAYRAGGRPGSAGHPRSQGPHATGARRRPLSAMAPRDRQAAMIEDMMSRHPSTWDIREVATWVEFIGMGQYRIKFVHHSIDGTLLLSLGEPELARDMRILPLGHRRALLGAIAELKEAAEAMEKDRADRGLAPGAAQTPKNENERVAELRRRGAQQEVSRRPASAGPNVIPPDPYLGPAVGKITVYEQRAKLLYQLDKARHRATQHAAIIDQLTNNKQLTEQQMADLRGKLKDLEAKHKDVLTPGRPGMTASVGGAAPGTGSPRHGHGTAALAAAEYGADAAVPWQPVGKGTRKANPNPERIARPGEDPGLDLTFRPRTVKLSEVPYGAVRDIVSKALGSRVPFWRRMDFEFEKARKEREAREEARRKRRERMGLTRRGGGGEGEDEEQAKSKYWNNFWVPGSQRNASYHKHFKKGSENVELMQYRSFAKDKTRLARWFRRFIDDGEDTEGDVALERLVNRMIRALVKTKEQADQEIGETFDKKIRRYFEERGYKFATHTSNTIMVRARGTRRPAPNRPDTTLYDFEEVEQYYPDYLRKRSAAAQEDYGLGAEDEEETRMVPKRTTWKWLTQMYYMDRQKKLRAAIAMVKMSQFVQRHGVRWPPERDKANDKKAVWVPNSNAGALHQVDGRDRTFNTVGQDNIGLHAKLKKALGPPQPVTFQMKMKQMEATEAKADQTYLEMGWPHSSGDPALGPPQEPLLMPHEDGLGGDGGGGGGGEGGDDFGLGLEAADGGGGGGGGGGGRHGGRARAPVMDFGQAIDSFLTRALDLRYMYDDWLESWRRARERGYGEDQLPTEPPSVNDMDWPPGDPLLALQERAMERQRQDWLLAWEKARRVRDRRAARMREQGYREADIEARLGKQQEAEEVESAVVHHLFINLTLMARHKPADLVKFRDELAGTKKKMAVWRAICNQKFIDETREKEYKRENTLRAIYDSLRVGGRKKVLDPDQEDACVGRLMTDVVKRERRMSERIEKKLEAEESSLTPWYVLHPPSRPVSRAVSPNRDSVSPGRRPRSPGPGGGGGARGAGAAVTPPRPRSASRAGRAPTGPDDPEPKAPGDRRKYVFGSSTPKSMWGPMGPVRGGTGRTPGRGGAAGAGGGGGSLLDSPAVQGLTSGGDRRERSPGAGRGGSSTPTRHRPTTPSQQRPRSAAPGPSPSPRPSGGGAPGPRRPVSAAGPAPPSPAGRGRPASPGPSRGPPVSPRRSTPSRVGFAPPPPSGRGRSSGGGAPPPRRGLMDTAGDTTGTDTSPERGPPRGGPAPPPRRGLADESESSPSPPPRRVPSQTTISAAAPAPPAQPAAPSRRSSQASGMSGPAARPGSGGPGAPPPPPAAGGSGGASRRASGAATPPGGLSQQPSAASGLGLPAGPSRSGVPPGREPSGTGSQPRASGTGSAAGSGGGGGGGSNASGSRRPSNTPPALGVQPSGGDLGGVGSSRRSLHSQGSTSSLGGPGAGGGKPGGSASGGLSGGPSGASGLGVGGAGSGGGSGAGTAPQQRSPLSRSPVDASPPAASPPAASPRGQPSSLRLSSEASNPPTAPPPAAAAAAPSASGRPRVEPSTGGGTTDYDDDEFDAGGELDVEYELDEADGAELDMGDVGGDEEF